MSVATGESPAGTAGVAGRPRLIERLFPYKRQLFFLTLPYIVGLVGLVLVPFLLSIPFAFTDYDALTAPRWVGLENFSEMGADSRFWTGIWSSLFIIAVAVPLRVVGATLLALLLYKPRPSNRVYRVLVYLPTIVPEVAYALLWLYIFNPLYGPLNWILTMFGGFSGGWLLIPSSARWAAVVMLVWTIGEGFIVMLASLQDIPGEISEAAEVDGASALQRLTRIILPLIAPSILLLLFRDIVLSFQFTFIPALITFEGGKPYYTNQFLPLYIWQTVTEDQQFGYASAMTWVMYGITTVIILLTFLIARRIRAAYYE